MIISKKDLPEIRRKNSNIVFACGCFNLLHPGHIYFLRKAALMGNLIVAIAHDEITKHKRVPVLNQQQRMYMVDNIKEVSYVVPEENKIPPRNIEGLLKELKPDYFVTNTDNPHLDSYLDMISRLKIRMNIFDRRTDGIFDISTTELIRRIERMYIIRGANENGYTG